jgi:CheY-like chemotaxis protein
MACFSMSSSSSGTSHPPRVSTQDIPTAQPSEQPAPLRILVADDEPLILSALKRILERRGHLVHTAADAATALELLGDHAFDAALVDARMPGDGLTVLAHLEDDASFDGVVVLMTGGLVTDPSVKVGPGVRRLQKPFSFPDVVPLLEGGDVRH